MRPFAQFRKKSAGLILLLPLLVSYSSAHQLPRHVSQSNSRSAKHTQFLKAFVIDDRLSALRREPSLQSEVIHRLRLGHPVFITRVWNGGVDQPRFYRIAITRRTRGWIYGSALAVQGRIGEDRRIMKLIEDAKEGLARIALCRILIERFSKSHLVPRALLQIGEVAERAATTLSQHARKRLAEVANADANARPRDYYLNDARLDRFSKLHVAFDFNESAAKYVYDGRAYRDVVRLFPNGEEANIARQRLDLARQKMARPQS